LRRLGSSAAPLIERLRGAAKRPANFIMTMTVRTPFQHLIEAQDCVAEQGELVRRPHRAVSPLYPEDVDIVGAELVGVSTLRRVVRGDPDPALVAATRNDLFILDALALIHTELFVNGHDVPASGTQRFGKPGIQRRIEQILTTSALLLLI